MPGPMVADTDASLAGLKVLVTRPAHQAEPFCQRLEAAGADAIRFPVLEITAPPRHASSVSTLSDLDLESFRLVIFISVNAVHRGLAQGFSTETWPQATRIAAIGRSTAAALAAHGLQVDLVPADGFTSEDLLALASLQRLHGQRVLIVRGVGGREALATALQARGAEVHYAEVYARALPAVDVQPLLQRWQQGGINAVTVTSGESLRNLWELLGPAGQPWLSRAGLVVAGARIADEARQLGFDGNLVVAADATDEAMFTALQQLSQAA